VDSRQEDAQETNPRRSSRSHRGSSGKSSRHKSKKPKRRTQETVVEAESGSDDEERRIPNSFVSNKENLRLSTNRDDQEMPGGSKRTIPLRGAKALEEAQAKAQEAVAEAEAKEKENEKLRRQLKALQAQESKLAAKNRKGRPKKGTDDPEEKAWIARIWKATKQFVWGRCKFINSEEKMNKAALTVCRNMQLKEFEGLEDKELLAAQKEWVVENIEHVRTGMNEARNYAQSQLRTEVLRCIKSGKLVLKPDEVLDCVTREPYLHEDPTKFPIFDYYHNTLLMKVNFKEWWDKDVRHYKTISKAKNEEYNNYASIDAGTEAFLFVLYENCYDKWQYLAECDKEGKKYDPKDPRMNCPYTDSDVGQNKYGGWNRAGRQRWIKVREKVQEARERDHVADMEEACLARIQEAEGVGKNDKPKKKRKRYQNEDSDDDGEDEFGF